ncbi:MAG: hypothetical protein U1E59_03885 [Amaricoccus sp.]
MLRSGACDVRAGIASLLHGPRFNGWIVVEEESETAAADPVAAVRADREAMRRLALA